MATLPASTPAPPVRKRLDRAGIALSALCAVHCVLALLLAGAFGGLLLAPEIHESGLALALVIGAGAFTFGGLRRGSRAIVLVAGSGLVLMASALAVPHGAFEALLTIAGVALLGFAHWRNLHRAA